MIRNDGRAIPVTQHIYGSDDIYETLAAAEWLYKNTKNNTTKNLVLDFIVLYGRTLGNDDIVQQILNDIKSKPFKFLSIDFIKNISDLLEAEYITNITSDIDDLASLINYELNQEFLRARYGGMYNTASNSREMVFRISSIGFNWFNIIYEFVYNNKSLIDSVTIVRDEESTGISDYYYKHGNKIFNKLPIDEFITINGNPIVEKFSRLQNNRYYDLLSEGKSITQSFKNMNLSIIFDSCSLYNFEETLEFYSKVD